MEAKPADSASNEPKPYACWDCGAQISAEDNYCRKCGKGQGERVHWYYKHSGAIVLTLFIGPFSLYFVWRSPVLSKEAKWAYTVVIGLATWYALSATYTLWTSVQSMLGGMQLPY